MLGHQLVVHEVNKDYRALDFFNPVGAFHGIRYKGEMPVVLTPVAWLLQRRTTSPCRTLAAH